MNDSDQTVLFDCELNDDNCWIRAGRLGTVECNELDGRARSMCLYGDAMNELNVTACSMLPYLYRENIPHSNSIKIDCLLYVALGTEDVSICDRPEFPSSIKNGCKFDVAAKFLRPQLCSQFPEKFPVTQFMDRTCANCFCQSSFAAWHEESECYHVIHGNLLRDNGRTCGKAVRENKVSLCDEIVKTEDKAFCQLLSAWSSSDCDVIELADFKDRCYLEHASEPADCAVINSQDWFEACVIQTRSSVVLTEADCMRVNDERYYDYCTSLRAAEMNSTDICDSLVGGSKEDCLSMVDEGTYAAVDWSLILSPCMSKRKESQSREKFILEPSIDYVIPGMTDLPIR